MCTAPRCIPAVAYNYRGGRVYVLLAPYLHHPACALRAGSRRLAHTCFSHSNAVATQDHLFVSLILNVYLYLLYSHSVSIVTLQARFTFRTSLKPDGGDLESN